MQTLYDLEAPKKPTNLSLNSDLLKKSRALNINLSATLEQALRDKLAENEAENFSDRIKAFVEGKERSVFLEMGTLGSISSEIKNNENIQGLIVPDLSDKDCVLRYIARAHELGVNIKWESLLAENYQKISCVFDAQSRKQTYFPSV